MDISRPDKIKPYRTAPTRMRTNRRSIMTARNDAIRELDAMCRVGRNFCKYNPSCSKTHENLKWHIFCFLRDLKKDVVTEAIFTQKRGRADIVVLDDFLIIEILHSEKLETFEAKAEKYPKVFEIIGVSTTDSLIKIFNDISEMLELGSK